MYYRLVTHSDDIQIREVAFELDGRVPKPDFLIRCQIRPTAKNPFGTARIDFQLDWTIISYGALTQVGTE